MAATFQASLRKAISKNRTKLLKVEPKALEGDIEAIHDYRVALRRIRAALRLLKEDATANKLRKQAGNFARSTSHLRDLDVQIESAKTRQAPEAWIFALSVEREDALASARDELGKEKYERWKQRLEGWLEEPQEDEGSEALAAAVHDHVEEVWKHESASSEEDLHAIRIAVKRLRYLLEFFSKDLPKGTKRAIKGLTKVQDDLGEYHDLGISDAKLAKALEAAAGMAVHQPIAAYRAALAARKNELSPDQAVLKALSISRSLTSNEEA